MNCFIRYFTESICLESSRTIPTQLIMVDVIFTMKMMNQQVLLLLQELLILNVDIQHAL